MLHIEIDRHSKHYIYCLTVLYAGVPFRHKANYPQALLFHLFYGFITISRSIFCGRCIISIKQGSGAADGSFKNSGIGYRSGRVYAKAGYNLASAAAVFGRIRIFDIYL